MNTCTGLPYRTRGLRSALPSNQLWWYVTRRWPASSSALPSEWPSSMFLSCVVWFQEMVTKSEPLLTSTEPSPPEPKKLWSIQTFVEPSCTVIASSSQSSKFMFRMMTLPASLTLRPAPVSPEPVPTPTTVLSEATSFIPSGMESMPSTSRVSGSSDSSSSASVSPSVTVTVSPPAPPVVPPFSAAQPTGSSWSGSAGPSGAAAFSTPEPAPALTTPGTSSQGRTV